MCNCPAYTLLNLVPSAANISKSKRMQFIVFQCTVPSYIPDSQSINQSISESSVYFRLVAHSEPNTHTHTCTNVEH